MNQSILPVITLYQPWASWIARKWKLIETRTHNRFAGLKGKTILIHAGQTTDENAIHNIYLTHDQLVYKSDEIINGAIVCSAFVYDTGKLNGSHSQKALIECHTTERFGLFLQNIKSMEPIPVSGEMGIWYFDIETKQKVRKSEINKTLSLF